MRLRVSTSFLTVALPIEPPSSSSLRWLFVCVKLPSPQLSIGFQILIYRTVRVGEQKTPSTTLWSPSLEREAYLLRLRRMKKYSKMPRKYWNISHLIHPKRWYLSLPLEGGGPRSGGRSLLFPHPNSPINHNLKQITLSCDQQRKTYKVPRYLPAGAHLLPAGATRLR